MCVVIIEGETTSLSVLSVSLSLSVFSLLSRSTYAQYFLSLTALRFIPDHVVVEAAFHNDNGRARATAHCRASRCDGAFCGALHSVAGLVPDVSGGGRRQDSSHTDSTTLTSHARGRQS